ncbi:U11 protein [macacine betaherpesvirus 9]|uniref:U11 protein n=1 Tax=macacine betaherpesvirus 9 TaxID=2560568 RepID=A0A191S3S7_9BETA|nr:U11 protein [macacine betaherpesvirus 9]ANC96530.1 U11 protein [macacine betaherpesvirus 9]
MSNSPFAWISDEAKKSLTFFFNNLTKLPDVDMRKNLTVLNHCIVKTGSIINRVKTLYNMLVLWVKYHQALCIEKPDYDEVWQEILKIHNILKGYLESREMSNQFSSLISLDKFRFETDFQRVSNDLLVLGNTIRWGLVTKSGDYINLSAEEKDNIFQNLRMAERNMLCFKVYKIVDPWNENGYIVTNINRFLYLGKLLLTLTNSWSNLEKIAFNSIIEKRSEILGAVGYNADFDLVYSFKVLSFPLTSETVDTFLKILIQEFAVITKSLDLLNHQKSKLQHSIEFYTGFSNPETSTLSEETLVKFPEEKIQNPIEETLFAIPSEKQDQTQDSNVNIHSLTVKKPLLKLLDQPNNKYQVFQTGILDFTDNSLRSKKDQNFSDDEFDKNTEPIKLIDSFSNLEISDSNNVPKPVEMVILDSQQFPKQQISTYSELGSPENKNILDDVHLNQLPKKSAVDLQEILDLQERINKIKYNNHDIFQLPLEKRKKEVLQENLQTVDDEHDEIYVSRQNQNPNPENDITMPKSLNETLNTAENNDVDNFKHLAKYTFTDTAKKLRPESGSKWTPESSLIDVNRRNNILQKELVESGLGEKVQKLLTGFTDFISLEEKSLKDIISTSKKELAENDHLKDYNLKQILNPAAKNELFKNFSLNEKFEPIESPFFLPNVEIRDLHSGSLINVTEPTQENITQTKTDLETDLINLDESLKNDENDVVNQLVTHLKQPEVDHVENEES